MSGATSPHEEGEVAEEPPPAEQAQPTPMEVDAGSDRDAKESSAMDAGPGSAVPTNGASREGDNGGAPNGPASDTKEAEPPMMNGQHQPPAAMEEGEASSAAPPEGDGEGPRRGSKQFNSSSAAEASGSQHASSSSTAPQQQRPPEPPLPILPPAPLSVTSEEINFLLYRYMQECGYVHSAFSFAHESGVGRTRPRNAAAVPPGALVAFLQKGLQYVGMEESLAREARESASAHGGGGGGTAAAPSEQPPRTEPTDATGGPDFSLLCPRALHTLSRKDPPLKLRVPPASAAAATKARMEMEEKLTRDRRAGDFRRQARLLSEGGGRGLKHRTLELRGGKAEPDDDADADDDEEAMAAEAEVVVPEPAPKKRRKKKRGTKAAASSGEADDDAPLLPRGKKKAAAEAAAAAGGVDGIRGKGSKVQRQREALAQARAAAAHTAADNGAGGQTMEALRAAAAAGQVLPPGMAAAVAALATHQQQPPGANQGSRDGTPLQQQQQQQRQQEYQMQQQRRHQQQLWQQRAAQAQGDPGRGPPPPQSAAFPPLDGAAMPPRRDEAAEVARQRAELQAVLARRQQDIMAQHQQQGQQQPPPPGGGGGAGKSLGSQEANAIAALMQAAGQGQPATGQGHDSLPQGIPSSSSSAGGNHHPPNDALPIAMPGDKRGTAAATATPPSSSVATSDRPSAAAIDEEDRRTAIPPSSVMELSQHTSEVFMCAWNPRFTNLIATGSGDASARIWALAGSDAAGGCRHSILLPHGHDGQDRKNKDVTTLEWSRDGELLATGSYDGVARVWSRNGELRQTLKGHRGPIFSLKWNGRGNYLLSGSYDKSTIVWDVAGDVGYVKQQFSYHFAPALDVDWKDDVTFASCSTDKTVQICRVGLARPIKTYTGHADEVNAVKWDPSGTLLASCSDDCTAKVWDIDSPRNEPKWDFTSHQQEIYTVKWSPTGPGSRNPTKVRMLATASFDGSVRLWNVADGTCMRILSRHRESVYSVAFSPSGEYLASGSLAGQLYIWNVADGRHIQSFKGKGDIFEVAWNMEETRVAACFSSNVVSVIDFRMP